MSNARLGAASTSKVRLILFDVGGTLAHPSPSFNALIAQVCSSHGLPVTEQTASTAETAVWGKIRRAPETMRGFSLSPERSQTFWHWVYRCYLDELGFKEAAQSDLPARLYQTFSRPESYAMYSDVLPTLTALSATGVTLGVVSNWESWLDSLLTHLRVSHFFQVSVVSGQAGIEKPDPAIFHMALERAGVSAAETVHVGDNPNDDVAGAHAAGIASILIDRSGSARYGPASDASRPRAGGQGQDGTTPSSIAGRGRDETTLSRGASAEPTPMARVAALTEIPSLLGLA